MRWTAIRPELFRVLVVLSVLGSAILAGTAGNRWN
jgi:hypothetical protein